MTDQSPSPRLCDLPVDDFLAAVADGTPAPGGGAVAALAGALGAALVTMVAQLTIGRARYAAHAAEVAAALLRAAALRQTLTGLVDADAAAYGMLAIVYKMPTATEAAKAERTAAIQSALRAATETPLAAAGACLEVLALAGQMAAHGNRNATGDAAVAALIAHAGLHGSARNVWINLTGIQDATFRAAAGQRVAELLAEGEQALAAALRAADAGV